MLEKREPGTLQERKAEMRKARKAEEANALQHRAGDAIKGLFSGSLTDPLDPQGVQQVIAENPPALGLEYITGFWQAPWLINLEDFPHEQTTRVKFQIAHDPLGDLATAYAMGVADGADGKAKWRSPRRGYIKKVVTPDWFVAQGLPGIARGLIDSQAPDPTSDPTLRRLPPRDPMKLHEEE